MGVKAGHLSLQPSPLTQSKGGINGAGRFGLITKMVGVMGQLLKGTVRSSTAECTVLSTHPHAYKSSTVIESTAGG